MGLSVETVTLMAAGITVWSSHFLLSGLNVGRMECCLLGHNSGRGIKEGHKEWTLKYWTNDSQVKLMDKPVSIRRDSEWVNISLEFSIFPFSILYPSLCINYTDILNF